MKKSFFYISIAVIIFTIFSFIFFRETPSGELWKGYSVLYVPVNTDENLVLNALEESEIFDVTCLSNQYLPINLSSNSPEVSMMRFNKNAMEYITKRNNMFFDKSHQYSLFYIPHSNSNLKSKIANVISLLEESGVAPGVDASTSYPIFLPIAVLFILLLLVLFSKHKFMYFASGLFFPLYTLCFPYITSCVSSIIFLIVFFMIENIYRRRNAVKVIRKNGFVIISIFICAFSVFSASILATINFILAIFSSVSAICVYHYLNINLFEKKYEFNPVLIRSASSINLFSEKEKIIFPVCIAVLVSASAFSIFSADSLSIKNDSKMSFPSSSSVIKSEELPSLQDFYEWNYLVQTFPKRSLYENNYNPLSEFDFTRYLEMNGKIITTTEHFRFDDEFKNQTKKQIETFTFPAVEKVLSEQGESFTPGYAVSVSHRLSFFAIMIVLVQLIFMGIYFVSVMNKPKKSVLLSYNINLYKNDKKGSVKKVQKTRKKILEGNKK